MESCKDEPSTNPECLQEPLFVSCDIKKEIDTTEDMYMEMKTEDEVHEENIKEDIHFDSENQPESLHELCGSERKCVTQDTMTKTEDGFNIKRIKDEPQSDSDTEAGPSHEHGDIKSEDVSITLKTEDKHEMDPMASSCETSMQDEIITGPTPFSSFESAKLKTDGSKKVSLLKMALMGKCQRRPECTYTSGALDETLSDKLQLSENQLSDQQPSILGIDKEVVSQKSILQYQRFHKTYACNMCDKSFDQKYHLREHKYFHTGERPYKCDICDKTFNLAHSWKRHKRNHTGERSFLCNICQRAFSYSNHLKDHLLTHSGERPFVCSVCNKGFSKKSNLNTHVAIHTGERPFVCDVCGVRFIKKNGLKKHLLCHTK